MHPIAELLKDRHAGSILDVGTRYGDFIRTVTSHATGADYAVGIDIDIESLVSARKKSHGKNIKYLAASAVLLPFISDSFDTVVMSNALHHLPDVTRGLDEMLRVLRAGGMLIVAEYIRDNPSAAQGSFIALHDLSGDIARFSGVNHRHFYDRDDVLGIIGSLDLEGIHTRDADPSPEEHDPATIEIRADGFFSHLDEIAGTPAYDWYCKATITARMRAVRTGIQSPMQLYVAGRKRGSK